MLCNEWVRSLVLPLYALRHLNEDCKQQVMGWLPFDLCASCYRCGHPLVLMNKYGSVFVSNEAASYNACWWCFLCES